MYKEYVFLEKRRVQDESRQLERFNSIIPSFEKQCDALLNNYDFKKVHSHSLYTDSNKILLENALYVSDTSFMSISVYNNSFEGGLSHNEFIYDSLCYPKKSHPGLSKNLLAIIQVSSSSSFMDAIDEKINRYKGILRYSPQFEQIPLSLANAQMEKQGLDYLPLRNKPL